MQCVLACFCISAHEDVNHFFGASTDLNEKTYDGEHLASTRIFPLVIVILLLIVAPSLVSSATLVPVSVLVPIPSRFCCCVNGGRLTSVCPVCDKITASSMLLSWLPLFRYTIITMLHIRYEYHELADLFY